MPYDSMPYYFMWILPISCLIFAIIKDEEVKNMGLKPASNWGGFRHHSPTGAGVSFGASGRTGEIPARLHLENPMTIQRGYALRRSTASACQRERYAADKVGVGTDLDRTAHPYQRHTCMRVCLCINRFVQYSRARLTWRTLVFVVNHGGVTLWAKIVPP